MEISRLLQILDSSEKYELFTLLTKEFSIKTRIRDFISSNPQMTTRLKKCLIDYDKRKDFDEFIEFINMDDLMRLRNMGKTTLNEFIKLRGY